MRFRLGNLVMFLVMIVLLMILVFCLNLCDLVSDVWVLEIVNFVREMIFFFLGEVVVFVGVGEMV